ncbi:MAG: hypothetical protein QM539_04465 [Alphaproteobacteria bacterium]|nr:hypothetical protein [Alphaproteobacteria bacterium]
MDTLKNIKKYLKSLFTYNLFKKPPTVLQIGVCGNPGSGKTVLIDAMFSIFAGGQAWKYKPINNYLRFDGEENLFDGNSYIRSANLLTQINIQFPGKHETTSRGIWYENTYFTNLTIQRKIFGILPNNHNIVFLIRNIPGEAFQKLTKHINNKTIYDILKDFLAPIPLIKSIDKISDCVYRESELSQLMYLNINIEEKDINHKNDDDRVLVDNNFNEIKEFNEKLSIIKNFNEPEKIKALNNIIVNVNEKIVDFNNLTNGYRNLFNSNANIERSHILYRLKLYFRVYLWKKYNDTIDAILMTDISLYFFDFLYIITSSRTILCNEYPENANDVFVSLNTLIADNRNFKYIKCLTKFDKAIEGRILDDFFTDKLTDFETYCTQMNEFYEKNNIPGDYNFWTSVSFNGEENRFFNFGTNGKNNWNANNSHQRTSLGVFEMLMFILHHDCNVRISDTALQIDEKLKSFRSKIENISLKNE